LGYIEIVLGYKQVIDEIVLGYIEVVLGYIEIVLGYIEVVLGYKQVTILTWSSKIIHATPLQLLYLTISPLF
jgi:hypothetical protein